MNKIKYYAGWDGGGTGTTIECINEQGDTVLRAKTGPLNPLGNPVSVVERSVKEALEHMAGFPISGLCIGGAGVTGEKSRAVLAQALGGAGFPYHIVTDFETAFYGAFNGGPGMILIAGTGAVCYGKNAEGKPHRCGGWGNIFDDEGSGYAIGRDILKAVARSLDGRAKPTALTGLLFNEWKVCSMAEIINKAYAPETGKKEIAALASLCFKTAEDYAVVEILDKAAVSLVELLIATQNAIGVNNTVLLGGLLQENGPLKNRLEKILKTNTDSCINICAPVADAARGAALMAANIF